MSDNFESSLINLGELSKPATVLVEKISEAVGGIFKPYQIVRVAKAEAQADRVRAEGQIEISDLQRRAFHRFLNEEALKQKNIEEITQKALPLLNEDSQPREIENDWIVNFFDRCRLISDADMQTLWSRVLAGEANSPGTFSKRTLHFLTGLDKREAEMFTSLCGFMWDIGKPVPIIFLGNSGLMEMYEKLKEMYEKRRIGVQFLKDLESIGLIQFTNDGFRETLSSNETSYYGRRAVWKSTTGEPIVLQLGRVRLTNVGAELAPICGAKSVDGFFEYMISNWPVYYGTTVREVTNQTPSERESK